MYFRTKVTFGVLATLAIIQVIWWSYLLIDQQTLIATLNPDFTEKTTQFQRMIIFEAGFFIFFWSLSLWYTYKTYREQIQLKRAHTAFLGAISHELKTPLANIRLCLDTLERPDIGEEKINTYISRANSALNTLHDQVENILTLSSIDRLSDDKTSFKIRTLVEDTVASYVQTNKISSDLVTINIDKNLEVFAPPISSQLIFKNILDNAIKYSQKSDDRRIHISAEKKQNQVILEVADKGIGMTEAEIKASMTPFWRGERVIAEAFPGTGVGLTLVQEIAQRSDIHIRFESEGIDQGVTVRIIWETF